MKNKRIFIIGNFLLLLVFSYIGCDVENMETLNNTPAYQANITTSLQAENAVINWGNIESEYSGYTGSGYANTENENGYYIEFSLTATMAAPYDLTFTYALESGNRYSSIQVNGSTEVSTIDFNATGAWSTWQTSSAAVNLRQGTNTIRLTAEQSEGLPNIDRMDVYGYAVKENEPQPSSDIPPIGTPQGQNVNNGPITGASCTPSGSVRVNATIRVERGQVYDGKCQVFNPTSAVGNGSQDEGQDPVFRVTGGTLKNVIIGNNGADGIHLYGGSATLDNITFQNVGEDAITIKESGTYTVRNIEGYNGEDKFIQINARSTLNVSNCIINKMGKGLRENGGKNYPVNVHFDRCEITNMKEAVARSDGKDSKFRITNSHVINSGHVCKGAWANSNDCKVENTKLTGTSLYTN